MFYIKVKPKCCECGTEDNVTFDSDPFNSEIHGDDTPVWECEECRQNSALEI